MTDLPYRTGKTWLSDDEMILLDVLFDSKRCPVRLLRRSSFCEQWNFCNSHGFDNEELRRCLRKLCRRGVLKAENDEDGTFLSMTPTGGKMWSLERCPVWNRYCRERYKELSGDRTTMTVIAVSSATRDDFLRIWPMNPARHRAAIVTDHGLIVWHNFRELHVGLATYSEQREWSLEEYEEFNIRWRDHWEMVERERTWWRSVSELQRFIPGNKNV